MGTTSTKKFVILDTGLYAEEYALITSAGAADAHRLVALNASGLVDDTMLGASATSSANKVAKMNGSGVLDDGIIGASATVAANKIAKLNASGILNDALMNATAVKTANAVVKMNASGLIDDAIINAVSASSGAADSGKIAKLNASGILPDGFLNATVASAANKVVKLDGSGKLDPTVMPTGVGVDAQIILSSEALAAGDLVNVWNNAGVANVRKADGSTSGKEAQGFVLVAFASGVAATVYFEGTNTQMTGLTPGVQFLSATTAGKSSATPPSGGGKVVQRVGFAVSATAMNFQSGDPCRLAV